MFEIWGKASGNWQRPQEKNQLLELTLRELKKFPISNRSPLVNYLCLQNRFNFLHSHTWRHYLMKWVKFTAEQPLNIFIVIFFCCAHRVFWPKIYFTPIVSRLGGQVGHQKKRNSSRNWLFLVSCATFQPKLNNFQKCPKQRQKIPILSGFWKFAQFWLKSSAQNNK